MPSSAVLASLPDIDSLRRLSQSLAVLDAIMSPDWENRYYSFNSKWSNSSMMASMRNGSGDEYFILFTAHGAIAKGFAHESLMSPYAAEPKRLWPGVADSIPAEFRDIHDPAFSMDDTTFCIWRNYADGVWLTGDISYPDERDPDGSGELLALLDGNPLSYRTFADEYYEQDIDLEAIEHVYRHRPLTDAVIMALNADVSKEELAGELAEIGYPGR